MATVSVTSKGQVTIPVEVRNKMGIKAGARLYFVENGDGDFVLKVKTGSLDDLRGIVKRKGKPASIRAMNRAIRNGWAGKLDG